MDKKSSMSIISDMNQYMQFQTATAIESAAKNQGTAGDSMGLGAGVGLGMILPQAMMSSFNATPQSQSNAVGNSDTLESKLKTLKSLLDQSLISEEEYKTKKEKILESL